MSRKKRKINPKNERQRPTAYEESWKMTIINKTTKLTTQLSLVCVLNKTEKSRHSHRQKPLNFSRWGQAY